MGFAAYPGARELCDQYVVGSSAHRRVEIHWRSFASRDAFADVAAFYVKREPKNAERKSDSLEVHHGANQILTVSTASNKELPSCATKPKPTERSVIVVSAKTE